jgi:hypothetical protein
VSTMLTCRQGSIHQTTRYGRPSTEVRVCHIATRTGTTQAKASGSRRSGSAHQQTYVMDDGVCMSKRKRD